MDQLVTDGSLFASLWLDREATSKTDEEEEN